MRKIMLAATALTPLAAGVAPAADIEGKSRIDRVTVYPDAATMNRLFIITARNLPTQRIINRLWTRVKTGR